MTIPIHSLPMFPLSNQISTPRICKSSHPHVSFPSIFLKLSCFSHRTKKIVVLRPWFQRKAGLSNTKSVSPFTHPVRGRSTSSDVSSDISPSPLYIPPHRRQPKTECTRGSDTGVRWSRDVTFLSLFHHSPYFSSFHYFSLIYYFDSDFLVYRHASHLSRALSFSFRIPC